MNKIVLILTLFGSVLTSHFAGAQDRPDTVQYNLLCKKLVKNVIFPRSVSESCKSSVVSMVVTFDGRNMLRNIAYSANFPEPLLEEIRKNVNIFMEISWTRMFPGLTGKTGYSILIPLIYYFNMDCAEQISSIEFSRVVEQGLTFDNPSGGDMQIVKPVVIQLTPPRP